MAESVGTSDRRTATGIAGKPKETVMITWCARQESNLRPLASEANGIAVFTPENSICQARGHVWRRIWIAGLLALSVSTAASAAGFNPYDPAHLAAVAVTRSTDFYPYGATPCSGSWDGVGLSACELLGRPGTIGGLSFAAFGLPQTQTVVESITARPGGVLSVTSAGVLTYANGFDVFDSVAHPRQFAFWLEDEHTALVGVEDLTAGDFDYNDLIVRFDFPRGVPFSSPPPVPEPAAVGLVLLGIAAALRRALRRSRGADGGR